MGVYVKNMTFPKSCSVCDFKSVMGYCRRMPPEFYGCTRDEGRPDWCPLVEVREPHGDLIDRDILKKSVLKWLPHDPCGVEERERPFETDICVSMMMEIEEQPVVIEGERGE